MGSFANYFFIKITLSKGLTHAQSVCQLLGKLAKLKLQVPIPLVLDKARYQRCALVQSVANSLGIELLY
jgi:hypothetical protein